MIEAGVWKLTSPFLPSERRYGELREEVDGFIGRVRQERLSTRWPTLLRPWCSFPDRCSQLVPGLRMGPCGERFSFRP